MRCERKITVEGYIITTECYIRRGDEILFIHKGGTDMNSGKFLGIGGHFEKGESPVECIVREINEETGIKREELSNLKMRAIITFVNPKYEDEYIYLFEADYTGKEDPALRACDEGELKWVNRKDVFDLPVWEGDKRMFEEMFKDNEFFTMKLVYDGDDLEKVIVD